MSPDHWSKLTWDTVSAGGYDLFGPIGYLDRIRDRACKQRVIVTPANLTTITTLTTITDGKHESIFCFCNLKDEKYVVLFMQT